MSKSEEKRFLGFSDENVLREEIAKNQAQNANLASAEVRLIGDKITLVQVVKLLSYVRHALNERRPVEFKVKVGYEIADGQLAFDVNKLEVPDCITQEEVCID